VHVCVRHAHTHTYKRYVCNICILLHQVMAMEQIAGNSGLVEVNLGCIDDGDYADVTVSTLSPACVVCVYACVCVRMCIDDADFTCHGEYIVSFLSLSLSLSVCVCVCLCMCACVCIDDEDYADVTVSTFPPMCVRACVCLCLCLYLCLCV